MISKKSRIVFGHLISILVGLMSLGLVQLMGVSRADESYGVPIHKFDR